MIIDKLFKRVESASPICVGLDTDISYIPDFLKEEYDSISDLVFEFNKRVIDSTKNYVAIYKLQIAYYEALGLEGLDAYSRTLKYLRDENLLSIGDIKRGDIAATGDMYAKAHFTGDFEADFITVNPYMGFDTISPYLPYMLNNDKGIFVLLKTSNEGAADIEDLETEKEKKVYEHVGDYLAELSAGYMGICGYSSIGMVVGATHPEDAESIRGRYPDNFFLVPGYGAQGGKGSDIKKYMRENNGAIINSSRGILKATLGKEVTRENFGSFFEKAVLDMKEDLEG